MPKDRFEGTVTITLKRKKSLTASYAPDLGHDAYYLMKKIPEIEFIDSNKVVRKMSEWYEVVGFETSGDFE